MYIKNQTFKDEDTLLEMLFDFSLGVPSPFVDDLIRKIVADLELNEEYTKYRSTLEEEDRLELEAEEKDLRLAEVLMEQFDAFSVEKQTLYGIRNNEKTHLYSIDLV
jgi:hypothetical protein